MSDEDYNRGLVGTELPTAVDDGEWIGERVNRYGEKHVIPSGNFATALADEGSYFVVTNPTSGTGLIGIAASTSYDALETFLHMRNTSTTKKVYLHYMHLRCTAAGTTGTTFGVTLMGDRGASRYTSGGATLTPVSPNMSSAASAAAVVIKAGPCITTAATSDARLIGDYPIKTVIKVIGDSFLFNFGADVNQLGFGTPLEGTLQTSVVIPCPPVILGENDQFFVHDYGASQGTGAAYTLSLGFWLK